MEKQRIVHEEQVKEQTRNVCFGVEKQQRIQRHLVQHANEHGRLAGWGVPLGITCIRKK